MSVVYVRDLWEKPATGALCAVPYIVQSIHLGVGDKRGTVHMWYYPVWAITGMPFRVGYVYRGSWRKNRQA